MRAESSFRCCGNSDHAAGRGRNAPANLQKQSVQRPVQRVKVVFESALALRIFLVRCSVKRCCGFGLRRLLWGSSFGLSCNRFGRIGHTAMTAIARWSLLFRRVRPVRALERHGGSKGFWWNREEPEFALPLEDPAPFTALARLRWASASWRLSTFSAVCLNAPISA